METQKIHAALQKLADNLADNRAKGIHHLDRSTTPPVIRWVGKADEDITILVSHYDQEMELNETPANHDFFYFSYVYEGACRITSGKRGNNYLINRGGVYAGQPNLTSALQWVAAGTTDVSIVIRTDVFFRRFLSSFASNPFLFRFFIEPSRDKNANRRIIIHQSDQSDLRDLMALISVSYAEDEKNPEYVRALTMAFILECARLYHLQEKEALSDTKAEHFISYISENLSSITLSDLAFHFGYNPSYASWLVHHETGKTFNHLVLELRMERAALLLKSTNLTISEIAEMTGYENMSNFYSMFRRYYGASPGRIRKRQSDYSNEKSPVKNAEH